jgi:DivIVA domain-containing protein
MALLTAEDVLNKAFSKTKYREGFDQDEVDDFLDEVANTIAQLTAERDDLAARLANGAPAAAIAPAPAPMAEAPTTTGLLAAATEPGGVNPTGMLAMAQKLHDEYVQAGEAERDRIIDEANVAADQIRERADDDAKARMDALAGERAELEGRIDDLRRFERDYRARLKTYLENLLGDLDHTTGVGAGAVAGLAGGALGADQAADWAAVEEPVADVVEEPADVAPEFTEASDATEDAAIDAFTGGDSFAGESYEGEAEEPEVAVVETIADEEPVPFEQALGGFNPVVPTPAAPTPAAPAEPSAEQPPTAPSYDASQSWESQLRPQGDAPFANPFAPVTQPAQPQPEATPATNEVPSVETASEQEEAPYRPPSSRMFSDLYGQQRPQDEN